MADDDRRYGGSTFRCSTFRCRGRRFLLSPDAISHDCGTCSRDCSLLRVYLKILIASDARNKSVAEITPAKKCDDATHVTIKIYIVIFWSHARACACTRISHALSTRTVRVERYRNENETLSRMKIAAKTFERATGTFAGILLGKRSSQNRQTSFRPERR